VPVAGAAHGECAVFAGSDFLGIGDVEGGFASPRRVVSATPA
jgi:hypothetical protein